MTKSNFESANPKGASMEKGELHKIRRVGNLEVLTGLKTAEEVVATIPISAERLTELAEAGYAPHIRIDGGPPLFKAQETKWWIAHNLVKKYEGEDMQWGIKFEIVTPTNEAYRLQTCPPAEISALPGLLQMPIERVSPGVYFLCHQGKVVYVGQSVSVSQRVCNHALEGVKKFDSIYFINVPAFALDDVEGAFIRLLKPQYNGPPPTLKVADSDEQALHRFVYIYNLEKEPNHEHRS